MEKVTGIGGFFFRAQAPKELKKWYAEHLGIAPVAPENPYDPWEQAAGPTAFEPFPANTEYFGRESQQWKLNLRVANLGAMVAQLRAAKIEVSEPEHYPYGSFAHLQDPEGNPIELWEPK